MLKEISLNVDDIGISKLHRIKIGSNLIYVKNYLRTAFDLLDSNRIKNIKKLVGKYNLPVTWSVVPFYLDIYSWKKIRFDKALPRIFNLIKEYIDQGDEVIQHGNCHFFPDRKLLSNEEFWTDNLFLSLKEQKKLMAEGWETLTEMGLRPKKIIQFPCWKADNNSIKAIFQLDYKAILAIDLLKPQNVLENGTFGINKILSTKQIKLDKIDLNTFRDAKEPINLVMHPSNGKEFNNLRILLNYLSNKNVKYVKVSEMLEVFRKYKLNYLQKDS